MFLRFQRDIFRFHVSFQMCIDCLFCTNMIVSGSNPTNFAPDLIEDVQGVVLPLLPCVSDVSITVGFLSIFYHVFVIQVFIWVF